MAERFDLGALLKGTVSESDTGEERIEYIDLSLIDGDENNFYALSDIDQLAANIETVGLQQPLRVRTSETDPTRVLILSGHRRKAALDKLAREGAERFRRVPCIRERESGSAALRELKLIFANSDTRKMSSADLSKQAERVEALLVQLKAEGYDFPGRMRDHVAEACKLSATKLANLKVIREKLVPEAKKAWEKGDIKEDAALKLARLPAERQRKICDACKSTNQGSLRWLYANAVESYAEELESLDKLECALYGRKCGNVERKWECLSGQGPYYGNDCHTRCCSGCFRLASCKSACPSLSSEIAAAKAQKKEASVRAKAEKEEKERPDLELLQALWGRFKEAREKAGASLESVFGKTCWDASRFSTYIKDFERMEGGKIKATDDAPFAPHLFCLSDVRHLLKLADFLDCSLDYLFCRTDEAGPKQVVFGVDLAKDKVRWRTDPPPEGQWVFGRFDLGEGLRPTYSRVYSFEGKLYLTRDFDLDYDLPLLGWIPLPEEG